MKTIELKATDETIDVKKNRIVYATGIEAGPGVIVLSDTTGEYGLMITNQIHNGGLVEVSMRPVNTPVKKFKVGDVIGTLVVLE